MKYNFITFVKQRKGKGDENDLIRFYGTNVRFPKTFLKKNDLEQMNYVTLSYDPKEKIIAFEFSGNSNTYCYKLNPAEKKINITSFLNKTEFKPESRYYEYEKIDNGNRIYFIVKL